MTFHIAFLAFLRHPNYVLATCEIACAPANSGLRIYAAVFSALNAAVWYLRISVENQALTDTADSDRL